MLSRKTDAVEAALCSSLFQAVCPSDIALGKSLDERSCSTARADLGRCHELCAIYAVVTAAEQSVRSRDPLGSWRRDGAKPSTTQEQNEAETRVETLVRHRAAAVARAAKLMRELAALQLTTSEVAAAHAKQMDAAVARAAVLERELASLQRTRSEGAAAQAEVATAQAERTGALRVRVRTMEQSRDHTLSVLLTLKKITRAIAERSGKRREGANTRALLEEVQSELTTAAETLARAHDSAGAESLSRGAEDSHERHSPVTVEEVDVHEAQLVEAIEAATNAISFSAIGSHSFTPERKPRRGGRIYT